MTINYTLPDFTSQDAATYKAGIDSSVAVNNELGGQFYTTQSATPAMSVSVSDGVLSSGAIVAAQTAVITPASLSNDRIDLVVIDTGGLASVIAGLEGALPEPPVTGAGQYPIATVYVSAFTTEIFNIFITDARSVVGTSEGGISDGTKRKIVHGFVDPDNVAMTPDDGTRTLTYSHSSGTVQFWSGANFYSFANEDARLSVTVADLTRASWTYFDIDGQLKYKTSLVWIDVKTTCLGNLAKYDADLNIFILAIARWEDCQANHVENYASYRSKGLQGVRGEGIDFTAAIGDTTTGYTSAAYLSARDFEFAIPSTNADAATWLRYHYNGVDDAGQLNINLSVSPAPTGTPIIKAEDVGLSGTNAIYNSINGGTGNFEVLICPSNDYVIGHIGIGDGGSQKVIALAPQGKYSTENEAREAIETEEQTLTNNDDVFRDVAVVASFIVKGNLSGGFLDATGNGDTFYLHSISQQGGGGGGANNQSYDDVLGINPVTDKNAVHTDGVNVLTLASDAILLDDGTDTSLLKADLLSFNDGTNGNHVEVNAAGITKDGGASSLVVENTILDEDIDISTNGGLTNIDKPTTTETPAQIIARGGEAISSVGALGEISELTNAAGTNVTINNDKSYSNASTITLSMETVVSSGISPNVGIITVDADYWPYDEVSNVSFVNSSEVTHTCHLHAGSGEVRPTFSSLSAGTYRFHITYARKKA